MDDHDIFTIKATRCKRCGGLLTNPDAVKNGYGHICMSKVSGDELRRTQEKNQITIFDMIGSEPNTNTKEE